MKLQFELPQGAKYITVKRLKELYASIGLSGLLQSEMLEQARAGTLYVVREDGSFDEYHTKHVCKYLIEAASVTAYFDTVLATEQNV